MATRISVFGNVATLSPESPRWICDNAKTTQYLNDLLESPGIVPGGEAVHPRRDIAERTVATFPEHAATILELDDETDDPSAYPEGAVI